PGGASLMVVPFDPDAQWGVKAVHHVNGTVNGCRVRVTLEPGDSGWAFTMNPARMQHAGIVAGSTVPVELSPEGPQRGDLAEDVAAALEANPAAGAFFDTLAQFYRKGYLRYIDATKRRPDLRAARIAEVTALLASQIKGRPGSGRSGQGRRPQRSKGSPGGVLAPEKAPRRPSPRSIAARSPATAAPPGGRNRFLSTSSGVVVPADRRTPRDRSVVMKLEPKGPRCQQRAWPTRGTTGRFRGNGL